MFALCLLDPVGPCALVFPENLKSLRSSVHASVRDLGLSQDGCDETELRVLDGCEHQGPARQTDDADAHLGATPPGEVGSESGFGLHGRACEHLVLDAHGLATGVEQRDEGRLTAERNDLGEPTLDQLGPKLIPGMAGKQTLGGPRRSLADEGCPEHAATQTGVEQPANGGRDSPGVHEGTCNR